MIIGAGMSGLLCGALNPGSIIYEAGPERESDHKALFRCKTDAIGKMLGIPFKRVEIHKSIWLNDQEVQPSPRVNHMYSQKVSGKISGRSITNIDSGIRFIPPDNFLDILKSRCNIEYNCPVSPEAIEQWGGKTPIVSTIPMPIMAKMMGRLHMDGIFESSPIYVNRVEIKDCESYCTMYYPDICFSAYRASLTGSTLIIEGMEPFQECDFGDVLGSLGIPWDGRFKEENKIQEMGKIVPIVDGIRQKVITKLTLENNIYSLGRFATWRPKVMLDDVLEDIFVIRRLIEGGNYASLHHEQGGK